MTTLLRVLDQLTERMYPVLIVAFFVYFVIVAVVLADAFVRELS